MKGKMMSYGMKAAPKVSSGKSAGNGHAVGSGSRPGGGTHKIPSSYPKNAKNIRG